MKSIFVCECGCMGGCILIMEGAVSPAQENGKIKTILREAFRLPAALASRMTYCVQVIFSIDFYSLLITCCRYSKRALDNQSAHWCVPDAITESEGKNFFYKAFIQDKALHVSSVNRMKPVRKKKKSCDFREQILKKRGREQNILNNEDTVPWKSVNEVGYGGCSAHAEC